METHNAEKAFLLEYWRYYKGETNIKHLVVRAVSASEALGKALEKYPDSLGVDWEVFSIDNMEEIYTVAEHCYQDYN